MLDIDGKLFGISVRRENCRREALQRDAIACTLEIRRAIAMRELLGDAPVYAVQAVDVLSELKQYYVY